MNNFYYKKQDNSSKLFRAIQTNNDPYVNCLLDQNDKLINNKILCLVKEYIINYNNYSYGLRDNVKCQIKINFMKQQ